MYKHIRRDNGEVFYVGISKSDFSTRPYVKRSRNRVWKEIVKETKYDVEVIHSGITLEEAYKIEKELIAKHGKILYGTGTLANVLDGGEDEWNRAKRLKIKRMYDKLGYKKPANIQKPKELRDIKVIYTEVKENNPLWKRTPKKNTRPRNLQEAYFNPKLNRWVGPEKPPKWIV